MISNLMSSESDLLVVGGGVAGLQAALEASIRGLDVTLLVKGGGAASTWILGFNAGLERTPSGDTPAKFFDDTMAGGCHLNNERLAAVLAYESSTEVHRLEQLGLDFRLDDGSYPVRLAAGSRFPRTVYFEDRTGPRIISFLLSQLQARKVDIRHGITAVRLIKSAGRVVGALAIDREEGQLAVFYARATVLATGGAGNLYSFTSNPQGITGDGYALSLRAGAELIDLEFVQFEPFIMAHPPDARGFGVPTTLVADGARIHDVHGREFLPTEPDGRIKSLTKDVFSRALFEQIRDGRGTEHGGVYFDVTRLPAAKLEGYPRFLARCRASGIDVKENPLEVAPAHHHMMGGVQIDKDCRTSLPGLFAAGEVTGGVHGANRLAGNAATDVLVFGQRAGRFASAYALTQDRGAPASSDLRENCDQVLSLVSPHANDSQAVEDVLVRLQQVMWEKVGIERDGAWLAEAMQEIQSLAFKLDTLRASEVRSLPALTETGNALLVAAMVAASAEIRKESRGDHYRTDYPFRDDLHWLGNILIQMDGNQLKLLFCPKGSSAGECEVKRLDILRNPHSSTPGPRD